ncbi:MAG: malate permease [Chloroflexota bacterium]|jgi:predicted permease|nr:malate permease [Chloroflexota bacterium]
MLEVLGDLLPIMVNVVAPVFLIAGVGFVVRRTLGIDPRTVTRLSLYVFVPALLMNTLLTTHMSGDDIGRIGIYAAMQVLILTAIGFGGSALAGVSRARASGITLGLAFLNSANYGLPVTLFAFGQDGFDRATVFVAFQTILTFTVATFVAARGNLPWRDAIRSVVKLPVVWAAAIAIVLRVTGVPIPLPIGRAVSTMAGGSIPIVILLLGMQVAGMRLGSVDRAVWAVVAGRLVLSPIIGLGLIALLQPTPLTAKVLVLEAGMPSAVNVILLATEFDAEPELVSSIVLISTLLSIITVTAWVAFLQAH